MTGPVVVGVDGSEVSREAVDWAADEAARRRLPLQVVHGWVWQRVEAPPTLVVADPAAERAFAEKVLADAEGQVRERHPELQVGTRLLHESGPRAVTEASAGASLAVVGSRGHGGFAGLLVGSVSLHLAANATCPVVVVRGAPEELRGPAEVLLGLDGRKPSPAAIGFAFEAAAARGVPLHVLHAWARPLPHGLTNALPLVWDPAEVAHHEGAVLTDALAGWPEKFPDVELVQSVSHDPAAKALVAASARAGLLVVGAHRRHGRVGMALGPVTHAVLHHAVCPVAVVPEDAEG